MTRVFEKLNGECPEFWANDIMYISVFSSFLLHGNTGVRFSHRDTVPVRVFRYIVTPLVQVWKICLYSPALNSHSRIMVSVFRLNLPQSAVLLQSEIFLIIHKVMVYTHKKRGGGRIFKNPTFSSCHYCMFYLMSQVFTVVINAAGANSRIIIL